MRGAFLVGVCFLVLASGVWAASDVVVDLTYFRPDAPPDQPRDRSPVKFRWTADWHYEGQFTQGEADVSGYFHIYLKNQSSSEVKITEVQVNGVPLPRLREKKTIHWWRVQTNPIAPEGMCEITIRLRHPPEKSLNTVLIKTDEGETIQCEVDTARPKLNITYIGFSKAIDTLHIHVEGGKEQIVSQIHLDGTDVTAEAKIYPPFNDLTFIKLNLSQPLVYGRHHVVKVTTSKGAATANMVRAWDNWFDITFWGGSQPPHPFLKDHFFEGTCFVSMGHKTPERIAIDGHIWKDREFAAYYLWDEPDVHDWKAGAYYGEVLTQSVSTGVLTIEYRFWLDTKHVSQLILDGRSTGRTREKINLRYAETYITYGGGKSDTEWWDDKAERNTGVPVLLGRWNDLKMVIDLDADTYTLSVGDHTSETLRASDQGEIERVAIRLEGSSLDFFLDAPASASGEPGAMRVTHDTMGILFEDDLEGALGAEIGSWVGPVTADMTSGATSDGPPGAAGGNDYLHVSRRDGAHRLGLHAQRLIEDTERIRRIDPKHLVYTIVDNTYTPNNWKIYGQVPDIMATDPYGIQDCINAGTLFYVVYAVEEAYAACGPRPLDITLGAFQLKRGGFQRLPTPQEERIMLYYALGAGAKGINYFIWGSDQYVGGVNESPALQEEIGRLNAELQVCSPLLSVSHPIPGKNVRSSTDDLWSRVLLAGEDHLVVVLVNNSYQYEDWQSEEGRYTLNTLEDVKLTVQVPPYVKVNDVRRIDHDGVKKLRWERRPKSEITVNVGDLEAGGMIVLSEDPTFLVRRYEDIVERLRREREEGIQRIERVRRETRQMLRKESSKLRGTPPVGAYYFMTGEGKTLVDATGNGNDGAIFMSSGDTDKYMTDVGTPNWTEGKRGGALFFDGKDDYVAIKSRPILHMKDAITIEAVFKAEGSGTLVSRGIDCLELFADDDGVGFLVSTDPENERRYELRAPMERGEWHHVAATYDKNRRDMKLYLNGRQVARREQSGLLQLSDKVIMNRANSIRGRTSDFVIGQRSHNNGNYFRGEIALVRLYDRALSEDEVLAQVR